jgi:hypothetical protein
MVRVLEMNAAAPQGGFEPNIKEAANYNVGSSGLVRTY